MVLSQKRSHKRAVKYAPYSPAKKTITQKKKELNPDQTFKFECLETTQQGKICKKWFSKSSLYSHLKNSHPDTCYSQEIPIEIRCCEKIRNFKWKTLVAKHCLLAEGKDPLHSKCSSVKNILADQVGHALTLK